MTYTVYDNNALRYCIFDPDLDRVSRWKYDLSDVTFDDGYSIRTMWNRIHGKSHNELIIYFNTHPFLTLISNFDNNSTYEYW